MHLRRYAWPGLTVVRDLIFVFFWVDIVWRCSASCAQTPELFSTFMCLFNCQRKNKKIIYANVYRNTINRRRFTDASSPDFSWGRGGVCTQATFIFEKKEERRKRVSSTGLICHVTKDGWPKNTVRLEFFVTYRGCFLNLRFLLFLSLRSIIPQVIDFAPTIR